jgi:hypothetical protein
MPEILFVTQASDTIENQDKDGIIPTDDNIFCDSPLQRAELPEDAYAASDQTSLSEIQKLSFGIVIERCKARVHF